MGDRVKVRFLPFEREVEVDKGRNLLDIAMDVGIHINASCGGAGSCGKCKVKVRGRVESKKSPKIQDWEWDEGWRLACQTTVQGDVEVFIPIESQIERSFLKKEIEAEVHVLSAKTLKELVKGWEIDPAVYKKYVELPPPTLDDNLADLERVIRELKKEGVDKITSPDYNVIKKMPRLLREADWKVTTTLVSLKSGFQKLINIEKGNTEERNYSIVIDLGTTTVFGQLLNLRKCKVEEIPSCEEGAILAEASDYNAQISYGEDVITRIIYSQKPGGLQRLQEVVVNTINGIIDELLSMTGIGREEISHMVIAGNTTMTQLFLGVDPKYIREEPYVPTAVFFPPVRAKDVGINLGDHVYIYVFPCVASYVGGDIVAGVLGTGIFQRDEVTLFLDIGTNGEIVLGNKDWLVCDACSAGPAFEGGTIKYGMRATRGAIEKVLIDPFTYEPTIMTIGRAKPKGICGSGMIDALAEMLKAKIIDQNGKINRDLPTDRIRPVEGSENQYEYVLAWAPQTAIGRDITITEVDIENLMRTKAAIYAGCKILVDKVGLTFDAVDRVIIAGGFGKHIHLENAILIGLLPELPHEKFMFVGNSCLLGTKLLSFSKKLMEEAERIASMMTHIELSADRSFYDEFVAALFLPHTNFDYFPSTVKELEAYWERIEQAKRRSA